MEIFNSDDFIVNRWFHLSECTLFQVKICFIYKNLFLGEKWKIMCVFFAVFFKLLPKYRNFVNSDNCIGKKLHQNLSDCNQFLFDKRFKFNKKGIIYSEKMRNPGNYIYDYDHFGKTKILQN